MATMLPFPSGREREGGGAFGKNFQISIISTIVVSLSLLVIADNVYVHSSKYISLGSSILKEQHFSESLDALTEAKMSHMSGKHIGASALSQSGPFVPVAGVEKVNVEIYLESQDRATQVLTEWVIGPVVGSADIDKILDLKIFAWGNSRLLNEDDSVSSANVNIEAVLKRGTPKFLCEHGPSECEGNAWINCLQDLYPDLHQWFRVFTCMETLSCSDAQAPVRDSIVGTGAAARLPCRGTPRAGENVGDCLRHRYWRLRPNIVQPFRPSNLFPGFCILKTI
jgi:hypothetical protein